MGIDLVGSGEKIVALVELERDSEKKIVDVAREIVSHNKNVKTVIEKSSGTKGDYRLRESKVVWGDENTEVLHKEYGYSLKLDPRMVYFSPRESTIRQFIAKQVKPGEKVLVMFAGVGPYAVCIAKTQPSVSEIVAVELNPKAVEYMRENVRINKISHLVTPIEGDVKHVCGKMEGEFDRIIMPMRDAKDFLGTAEWCAKKDATIYVYMVSGETEIYWDCEKELAGIMKRPYEVVERRKISLYAPGKWKVLIGMKLK